MADQRECVRTLLGLHGDAMGVQRSPKVISSKTSPIWKDAVAFLKAFWVDSMPFLERMEIPKSGALAVSPGAPRVRLWRVTQERISFWKGL